MSSPSEFDESSDSIESVSEDSSLDDASKEQMKMNGPTLGLGLQVVEYSIRPPQSLMGTDTCTGNTDNINKDTGKFTSDTDNNNKDLNEDESRRQKQRKRRRGVPKKKADSRSGII